MNAATDGRLNGRVVLGAALILFGVLFALNNLRLVEAGRVLMWWPLVPIAIGVMKVRRAPEDGQRPFGVALIALGLLFLFNTLLAWRFRDMWPVALMMLGGTLLWRGLAPKARRQAALADASHLSEFVFMGGGNRIVETRDFKGGEATAMLGGVEIDLRRAAIVDGPVVVDVFALWGGVELRVPVEWSVDVRITPILGGYENKVRGPDQGDLAPRLVVRGYAIMGGVGVKN
jgi:predicted membrane protein